MCNEQTFADPPLSSLSSLFARDRHLVRVVTARNYWPMRPAIDPEDHLFPRRSECIERGNNVSNFSSSSINLHVSAKSDKFDSFLFFFFRWKIWSKSDRKDLLFVDEELKYSSDLDMQRKYLNYFTMYYLFRFKYIIFYVIKVRVRYFATIQLYDFLMDARIVMNTKWMWVKKKNI